MKPNLMIIAGPCTIESKQQIFTLAKKLKKLNVDYLRGGAFKPRTSPYSFQGLGEEGLKYLSAAGKKYALKTISEIMGPEEILLMDTYVDVFQVGSRNMYNYDLLKKIAQRAPHKTVLLKRGLSATKKEVFGAINYLKKYGHKGEIIFCERGIRTFANHDYDRFTLDCNFISFLRKDPTFKLKIIADPSHSSGNAKFVESSAYAAIAAGAQGLIIEVKDNLKEKLLCDSSQAITIKLLEKIIKNSHKIHQIVN